MTTPPRYCAPIHWSFEFRTNGYCKGGGSGTVPLASVEKEGANGSGVRFFWARPDT